MLNKAQSMNVYKDYTSFHPILFGTQVAIARYYINVIK